MRNWNRLLHPQPVYLIVSRLGDKVNIMTAAWVTPVSFRPPLLAAAISPKRHTYKMIRETGEFVVCPVTREQLGVAHYCGTVSGASVDKVSRLGLRLAEPSRIGVPYPADAYAALECVVEDEFKAGDHSLFLGRVVAMHYREELFRESVLDVSKIDVLLHLGGKYYTTSSREIITPEK